MDRPHVVEIFWQTITSFDACVDERDSFVDGSVMVWEGIAHVVKAQLIVVEGNMTAVSTGMRSAEPLQDLSST